jgi:hypothetical protein
MKAIGQIIRADSDLLGDPVPAERLGVACVDDGRGLPDQLLGGPAERLQAACLIDGEERASFTRKSPGAAAAVRLAVEGTDLLADSSDARLIFIDIVDADGTVVWLENGEVKVTISGPGTIVGPQTLSMKGGQLAVWVRAGRTAGTVTLTASASGLTPAGIQLTSRPDNGLPPVPADRMGTRLFLFVQEAVLNQ